jgi:hypothetical protein
MVDNKKIVFIFETCGIKEFLDSIKTETDLLIICGNDAVKKELINLNYNCKLINEYSTNPILNIQKGLEWIKDWPDKPIFNGKSFKELLVYDNISIFWFIETRLYLYRIQNLIPLIEQLVYLVSKENPERIWIKGNNDAFFIMKQLMKNENSKIEFIGEKSQQISTSYKSYQGNSFFKLLALKLIRGFPSLASQKIKKNSVLVVTELSNWRNEYDYTEGRYLKKDVIFSTIIKKLSALSIPVQIIDFENQPGRLFKSLSITKEREKSFGTKVEPWEKYITIDTLNKTRTFSNKIKKLSKTISESEEFKQSLNHNELVLHDILKDDMLNILQSFKTYTSVTFNEAAKNILDTIKPSLIIMHDEYGTLQLCLIKEAKKRNIPTVAIQHGVNTETWISYIHKPDHVNNKNDKLNFPLPDKICVWGESARSNLIKFGNFPSSVPVVTGDPKTDFLYDAIKQFDNKKIKSELNILHEKNIIVYVTQTLSNIDEKSLIAKTVFHAVKNIENCYLIIKAHPNEPDLEFYRNIAKEIGMKNYVIKQEHNLYEILSISDVVIVPYSTVGIEAMRMRRPVIAMNLLNLHDDDPLIQSNIPFVIRTTEELIPVIQNCLDKEKINSMLDSGESFSLKQI